MRMCEDPEAIAKPLGESPHSTLMLFSGLSDPVIPIHGIGCSS